MRRISKIIPLTILISFGSSAFAEMQISSASIKDGKISSNQACSNKGGKNQSPQITVTNIPTDAKFISLIIDDPDAKPVAGKTWVHWNVFNIPTTGSDLSFEAGSKIEKAIIGKQSGGSGYGGMCPPNGKHTYRFSVYAHSSEVAAKAKGWNGVAYTIERFNKDFKTQIIEQSTITGDYN